MVFKLPVLNYILWKSDLFLIKWTEKCAAVVFIWEWMKKTQLLPLSCVNHKAAAKMSRTQHQLLNSGLFWDRASLGQRWSSLPKWHNFRGIWGFHHIPYPLLKMYIFLMFIRCSQHSFCFKHLVSETISIRMGESQFVIPSHWDPRLRGQESLLNAGFLIEGKEVDGPCVHEGSEWVPLKEKMLWSWQLLQTSLSTTFQQTQVSSAPETYYHFLYFYENFFKPW